MNVYLDSSVLLRVLLDQPMLLKKYLSYEQKVGSELLEVECLRTLDRMRVTGELSDDQCGLFKNALFEILETMEIIPPNRAILRRASGPFPVPIGTLDAIHLSTALAWRDDQGQELVVATHDKGFGKAARALGLKAEGF